MIGGQPRSCLAALDAATGAARDWNPNAGPAVTTLAVGGGSVYASGSFTHISQLPQSNVAAMSADPVAVTWRPQWLGLPLSSWPNPFATATRISYSLPASELVTLKIYDVAGRWVRTLLDHERRGPGPQQVDLDASRLATGVYLARLEAGGRMATQRIVLLREGRGD